MVADSYGIPPRYNLSMICNFRPLGRVKSWSLLKRTPTSMCGRSIQLREDPVTAGVWVPIPKSDPDAIIVMSFDPSPKPLWRRAAELALKDPNSLMVRLDGEAIRLPRALADGPLVVSAPSSLRWTGDRSARVPAPTHVSFNEDGVLRFAQISVAHG